MEDFVFSSFLFYFILFFLSLFALQKWDKEMTMTESDTNHTFMYVLKNNKSKNEQSEI